MSTPAWATENPTWRGGSGTEIGPEKGRIAIRLEQPMHQDLATSFPGADKPDHRILNIAYYLFREHRDRAVILVSKDMNLRMKARSVGLLAEDYTTDHVRDPQKLYTGCRFEESVSAECIERLYQAAEGEVPVGVFDGDRPFSPNEFAILKNGIAFQRFECAHL